MAVKTSQGDLYNNMAILCFIQSKARGQSNKQGVICGNRSWSGRKEGDTWIFA